MTVQLQEPVELEPRASAHADVAEKGRRFRLRELPPFVPAVALIAVWMVWIPASGAYFPNAWYPSAIGAVALVATMLLAGIRPLPRSRAARVALLSFAALVAFNYLSIGWAASPGSALDASNRLLLYLAVGWVFAVLPWTPRWLAGALGAWSLGVSAFCAVDLVRATQAAQLDPFFVQFRYATPLHYPNATAALAVMGAWPALILSARREVPAWVRALALGPATFLAGFALLPQSRGAALGMALTALLVVIMAPDRLRLLTRLAVVGGGIALVAPRTVAVDHAINAGRHVGPVLSHAAAGMLIASIGAVAAGALLALTDRFWSWESISSRRHRRLGRQGWVAVGVVVVVLAGVGAAAAAPSVSHLVRTVVRNGHTDANTGATRLFSTTPEERFDYARVGWRLFVEHPLLGVGAGNFGRSYDQLRRFEKHSQYTHDLPVRTLSETGIIGFGLFVSVVVALTVGLVRVRRELPGLPGACAVAALAVAAYFLVHGLVDWLDEFPVLAAPALAFALGAIALRGDGPGPGRPPSRLPGRFSSIDGAGRATPRTLAARIALWTATSAIFVLAMAALVFPYLETRYVEHALATFWSRPAAARSDLARAADLNPLSVDPLMSEGTIAVELRDFARARSAFQKAIDKEDDWYPRLELALIDANEGQFRSAHAELTAAERLDVHDPVLGKAAALLTSRKRIDPVGFNRQLLGGAQADLFAPEDIRK